LFFLQRQHLSSFLLGQYSEHERLILPRLPNPAMHHVRMQAMGQRNTANAGSRLPALGHNLRFERLAVFTPARPAIV
jgi:hypothetical protein